MKRYGIVLTSVALCALVQGCGRQNTFAPPPPPQVTVSAARVADVTLYREFVGRAQASDSVDIRARVRGYLEEVSFRDGATVETGDPLFLIEPDPYEAALKRAVASRDQAQANSKLADASFQRKERAFKANAISEIDLLAAEAEREVSEAGVAAAEAAVGTAELDLSYTKVTSPLKGHVSRRLVSVGNLVGVSEANLLARVVVDDPIDIYFNIDERAALRLLELVGQSGEPGEKVTEVALELADGTRVSRMGKIDYVDPEVDSATGTLAVRVKLANPERDLLPGLFIRVLVPMPVPQATLVPEIAVQSDMGGDYVMLVGGDSLVEKRYLKLGDRVEDERIVTEGIGGGERIIIGGVMRARPGAPVQVQSVSPEPAS